MSSPPERENNPQFVRLSGIFADQGVPVPVILSADESRGYFLLTDMGTRDLAGAYAENDTDAAVNAAIETLVTIQDVHHPDIPPYEVARFRTELEIFREWFIEKFLKGSFPGEQLDAALESLIEAAQDQPQCCVHRDFHCRNLLYGTNGQMGVVDFQDALIGPVSYDIASLLRDCYHRFSQSEIDRWRHRYLSMTPFDLDEKQFGKLLDFSAVQRQLKAIGIFSRLHLREERSSHLRFILPVLDELIEVTGLYPDLQALAGWLEDIRPQARSSLEGLV